jgi:hypothetical protein
MQKNKAYEEYAKWWGYWISKIPTPSSTYVKNIAKARLREKLAGLLPQARRTGVQRNWTDRENPGELMAVPCVGVNAKQPADTTDYWDD